MASSVVLIVALVAVVVVAVAFFVLTRKPKPGGSDDGGGGGGGGDDGGGGGGSGDDVPVYPIDQRPAPNGVDPLDDIPQGFTFPMPEVTVFCENWSIYRKDKFTMDLSQVVPEGCKRALYSFMGVSDSGKVLYSDQYADHDKNQLNGFVTLCKQKGIIPGMSIGGYTYSGTSEDIKSHRFSETFEDDSHYFKKLTGAETFQKIIQDATAQQVFIDSVGELVARHGFAHVDIDYEYPNCPAGTCDSARWDQRDAFTALIKKLCASQPNITFSICISPNIRVLHEGTDLKELNKISNLIINIMTYDYYVYDVTKPNDSTGHNQVMLPGHGAVATFNIQATLDYVSQQDNFDPEKYTIGLAAYGRTYPLTEEQLKAVVESNNASYIVYPKQDTPAFVFPASQQQGVVFASELPDLDMTDKGILWVRGDGMWYITSNPPGLIAAPSPRHWLAIRYMGYKYGINNSIVWTGGQDYTTTNGFHLLKYALTTEADPDIINFNKLEEPSADAAAPVKKKRRNPLRPSSLLAL